MSHQQTGSSSHRIIANSFIAKKKISSGSFGVVFLGQEIKTKDYVAIKIEKSTSDDVRSLDREVRSIYNSKNKTQILKHLHYHNMA